RAPMMSATGTCPMIHLKFYISQHSSSVIEFCASGDLHGRIILEGDRGQPDIQRFTI
ncbi:unnamed protein product, partial [Mycena citricolor]